MTDIRDTSLIQLLLFKQCVEDSDIPEKDDISVALGIVLSNSSDDMPLPMERLLQVYHKACEGVVEGLTVGEIAGLMRKNLTAG